jgi:hypothetical protein
MEMIIPRSMDDSFPHAVEIFLSARRALEFSHDQDPKRTSKRCSITSWARNRNASGIDLSFLLPIPSSRGMLIARNGLKHLPAS